MNCTLHHGDCLDILRTLPDNSVDSIVTDPPYGLSMMGKKWDYDVPSEDIWRECLRVLKPGGHLLAFAGTRTQHRMAVRIEDAGFEIRDMIAWVYGSGFPKSLDVSKAIDKANAEVGRLHKFTAWMRTTGLKAAQINDALKSAGLISKTSNFAVHYFNDSQPAIPTIDMWRIMRELFDDVPPWIDELVERIEAEREVVGQGSGAISRRKDLRNDKGTVWGADSSTFNITAPATPAARQWHGWGTALKPALEPITVARKPLIGTVAENVLTWGTGGLNVDGCRVDFVSNADRKESTGKNQHLDFGTPPLTGNQVYGDYSMVQPQNYNPTGRWPANLIHDGSEEVVGVFPANVKGGTWNRTAGARHFNNDGEPTGYQTSGSDGSAGSAARFFYCAKASKRDRDEGCEEVIEAKQSGNEYRPNDDGTHGLQSRLHGSTTKGRNHHPTVKPTELMRYLCRLVTPPGGTVLDPFMGSGSTGKAAMLEGFHFIGIEREAEYIDIARSRIKKVMPLFTQCDDKF